MADGWIEWGGGDCPVEAGTPIDIRDEDGFVWNDVVALGHTNTETMWEGRDFFSGNNISAYRLIGESEVAISPEPANDNLTPRAQFDAMSPLQEELAINIAAQIANGVRPDAVQVLEWAAALYKAEVGAA